MVILHDSNADDSASMEHVYGKNLVIKILTELQNELPNGIGKNLVKSIFLAVMVFGHLVDTDCSDDESDNELDCEDII